MNNRRIGVFRHTVRYTADLIAHIIGGLVDIAAHIEFEIDAAEAVARVRIDGINALNAADLLFDNFDDLRFNDLGRCSRVTDVHADNRSIDVRCFAHRQTGAGEQAENHEQ